MAFARLSPARALFSVAVGLSACLGGSFADGADCNRNCVEDAEELSFRDCNANGIPDDCDLTASGVDFVQGLSFFPGGVPHLLQPVDLDGDALPDVLTEDAVDQGPGSGVSIHFNDGRGGLESPSSRMLPGSVPGTLVHADLDRDGDVDLAMASWRYEGCRRAPDRVFIIENLGRRDLAAAVAFEAGQDAMDLAAADLDLDGDADLVSLDVAPGPPPFAAITVLRNRGDASLDPPERRPTTAPALSLAAVDLDGDADIDLAAVPQSAGHVSFFSNAGDASFGPPVTLPVADFLDSVFSDDIDGDGDFDLVVSSRTDSIAAVLENADGAWRKELVESAGGACTADIDRDGLRDLVAPTGGNAHIFRNTALGFVDDGNSVYLQGTLRGVSSEDMDGDGDEDVVALSGGFAEDTARSSSIRIVRNEGGSLQGFLSIEGSIVALAAADFDADGDVDLSGPGLILRNSGTGRFPARDWLPYGEPGKTTTSLGTGDLDGDADLDLVETSFVDVGFHGPRLQVHRNDGTARFPTRLDLFSAGGSFFDRARVSVADVDGDRDLDIVAIVVRSQLSLFINEGNGTFVLGERALSGSGPLVLATGDLDGDGFADAITGNAEQEGTANVSVFRSRGDGAFLVGRNYAAGSEATWLALGDIDADGDLDAAADGIQILENDGDGAFESRRVHESETLSGVLVDLDGDGDLDIAAGGSAILLNDGTGAFHFRTRPAETEGRRLLAADLDGDRDLDLIDEGVSVAWNEGDGAFGAPWLSLVPAYPRLTGIGDRDADGDLDLSAASGSFTGSLDAGGHGRFESAEWRLVVPGEAILNMAQVDMDRKADLDLLLVTAAVRTDQTWRLALVEVLDGLDPAPKHVLDLGIFFGGAPALDLDTADLDGDGDLDLALVRSSCAPECVSTVFLVMNDGEGNLSSTPLPPIERRMESLVLVDLDGDGDLDIATDGVSVLTNRGGAVFEPPALLTPACCGLDAGDVDGDGDADLVTGHAILRNGGDGRAFDESFHRSPLGSDAALGDLDADGFPDLVGSLPDRYDVGLLVNDGKGGFDAVAWLQGRTYVHFLEDLDADGRPDVVARASDGDFRIDWNRVHAPIAPGAYTDLDSDGDIDGCQTIRFTRGDATSDRNVDIADAIAILRHLFQGATEPGCLDAADVDDDSRINVTDPILVLVFLFQGGAPPAHPGPGEKCGRDGESDGIDCKAYPEC